MKLNVILITYKQENYIRQTLESVLMQKTTFDFDIIVADDCSPDATVDIIRQYVDKTNITFRFLPSERNLGFVKNYQRAFSACDADYVAIMEGDDYWTSASHLENHVKFLENHGACSMSFNRHIRYFEKENREEIFDWKTGKAYEEITTQQMIYGNKIGNLSCCVFRNRLLKQLDSAIFEGDFADWLLGMLMAQYGSLAYQKEVTSAYRIHSDGQWTRMSDRDQDRAVLEKIDEYDRFLNYEYTKDFAQLKKWKIINVYGDKSVRGRMKKIVPSPLMKLYRKLFR